MHQISDDLVSLSRQCAAEQSSCFVFCFLLLFFTFGASVMCSPRVARSTATANTAHKRPDSSISSAAGADILAFSLHGNRHHSRRLIPTDVKRVFSASARNRRSLDIMWHTLKLKQNSRVPPPRCRRWEMSWRRNVGPRLSPGIGGEAH